MNDITIPKATPADGERHGARHPDPRSAFLALGKAVRATGAPEDRTTHPNAPVTDVPMLPRRRGGLRIVRVLWVAAGTGMRAGAASAHSARVQNPIEGDRAP